MRNYIPNCSLSLVVGIFVLGGYLVNAQEKLPYSRFDSSKTVREYSVLYYELILPVSFDIISFSSCEMVANASGDLTRVDVSIPEDSMWMERSRDCAEFSYSSNAFPGLVVDVSSMLLGRMWYDDYEEQYKRWSETIDISYQAKGDNWYVLSGVGKYSGDIFYLRSEDGNSYNTKLKLRYPREYQESYNELVVEILNSFNGK